MSHDPGQHRHRRQDVPPGTTAAPPTLVVSRATPRLPPAAASTAGGRCLNLSQLARVAGDAGAVLAPCNPASAQQDLRCAPTELRPFERPDLAAGPLASLESKSSTSSDYKSSSSPATLVGEPAPLLGGGGDQANMGPLHSATSPTRGGSEVGSSHYHQRTASQLQQEQQSRRGSSKVLRPMPLYAACSSGSTTGFVPAASPGGLLEASSGAMTTANGSTVGRSSSSSVQHIMMVAEGVSASVSSPRGAELCASGSAPHSHHLQHHYGQGRQGLLEHLDRHAIMQGHPHPYHHHHHHQRQESVPFESMTPPLDVSGAGAALIGPGSPSQGGAGRKKPSFGRASIASLSLADLVERRTPADDGVCSTAVTSMAATNNNIHAPPPLLSLAPLGTSARASYASTATGADGAEPTSSAVGPDYGAGAPPAPRRRKGLGLSLNEEVLSLAASRASASRGLSQPPQDSHAESGDLGVSGGNVVAGRDAGAAGDATSQSQSHIRRPSSGLRLSDQLCVSRDGSGARRDQSSPDDDQEGGTRGNGHMTALEEAMAAMEAESRAMALRNARAGGVAVGVTRKALDESLVPPTPDASPGGRGLTRVRRAQHAQLDGTAGNGSPGPREVRQVVGATATFKGWELVDAATTATHCAAPQQPQSMTAGVGSIGGSPAPVEHAKPDSDMASPTPMARRKSAKAPHDTDRVDVVTVSPPTPSARSAPARQSSSPQLPPLVGPHGNHSQVQSVRSPLMGATVTATPRALPPLDASPARLPIGSGRSPALRAAPPQTSGTNTLDLPALRLPPMAPAAPPTSKFAPHSTPRSARGIQGPPKVTAGFLLPSLDPVEDETVLLAASATQVTDDSGAAAAAPAAASDAPPPRPRKSQSKRRRSLAIGEADADSPDAPAAARGSIKVLSYNLLAPRYAASDKYAHCPFVFLDQQYRFASAARQIADAAADLVLLQELPTGLAAPLSDFSSALRMGNIGALFHVPVSGRDVTPWPVLPPPYRVQKPLGDGRETADGAPPPIAPRFVSSAAQTFYNFAALSLVPYMDAVLAGRKPQPSAGPHPPVPCFWTTAAPAAALSDWGLAPEVPEVASDAVEGDLAAALAAGITNSLGLEDETNVTGLGIVSPADPRQDGMTLPDTAFASTPQSFAGVQPPLALRTNTWTPSSARSGNVPPALALFEPGAPTPTANGAAAAAAAGSAEVDPNRSAMPLNFATPLGNAALAAGGGMTFDTSFTALVGPQYRQLIPPHNPPLEGVAIGWNPDRFELLERLPLYFNFLAHRAQGEAFAGVADTIATVTVTSAPLSASQAHKLCVKSHNVAAIVVLRDRRASATPTSAGPAPSGHPTAGGEAAKQQSTEQPKGASIKAEEAPKGAGAERIIIAGTLHCFYMRARPDCQRWQVARLLEAMRALRVKYLSAIGAGASVSLVMGGDLNAEEGSLPLSFVQDPALHPGSLEALAPAAAARRSPTPPPVAASSSQQPQHAATARGLSSSAAAAAAGTTGDAHAETYSPPRQQRAGHARPGQSWLESESSPPACTPPAGAWRGRRGSKCQADGGVPAAPEVPGHAQPQLQRAATSEMAKRASWTDTSGAAATAVAPPGSASQSYRRRPDTYQRPLPLYAPAASNSLERRGPGIDEASALPAHTLPAPCGTASPQAPGAGGRKRGADTEVPMSPCRVAASSSSGGGGAGLRLVSAYKAAGYYANHPLHVSATDPEQVGARGVIDHLFFEPDQWRLRAVGMLAPAGEVPNAVDPSDHFPVSVWLEPR